MVNEFAIAFVFSCGFSTVLSPSVYPMALNVDAISVETFTRRKQTVSGVFSPHTLPRIKPFLADQDGEIHYTLKGTETTDAIGGRIRRVKCIISGWFLLFDPDTLEPTRHELSIKSSLVLVGNESALPPLEDEAADEDYVALGEEFVVADLVEEEILLDLPLWAIATGSQIGATNHKPKDAHRGKSGKKSIASGENSAFAKLASLKRKPD